MWPWPRTLAFPMCVASRTIPLTRTFSLLNSTLLLVSDHVLQNFSVQPVVLHSSQRYCGPAGGSSYPGWTLSLPQTYVHVVGLAVVELEADAPIGAGLVLRRA